MKACVIPDSPKVKVTQLTIHKLQTKCDIYSGASYSFEKEDNSDTCCKVDEPFFLYIHTHIHTHLF